MFWGVVSRNGPVCLVKVTGVVEKLEIWGKIKTMDQYGYLDLLSAYLLPYLEEHPEAIFQQDGASIHTSKVMMEFFTEFGCTPPSWPAKSPDLSVIENIWGLIKVALGKVNILTVTDLEYWVPKLWDRIVTPELCKRLYDSIPVRIEAVFWNDGARISY
jgi:hypothetical protein